MSVGTCWGHITHLSTAAETNMADGELSHRICSLPQELYDEILDFYLLMAAVDLCTTYKSTVRIYGYYRPPVHLQLSSKIRDDFAGWYYNKLGPSIMDRIHFVRWLASLPTEHILMLKYIQWKSYPGVESRRCYIVDLAASPEQWNTKPGVARRQSWSSDGRTFVAGEQAPSSLASSFDLWIPGDENRTKHPTLSLVAFGQPWKYLERVYLPAIPPELTFS